jgi:outer membrane protein
MSSRRLIMAIATVVSLSLSGTAHAQAAKLGYVNFQKALAEIDEAKAAKERLEKLKTQKQTDLDKVQESFKKEQEAFQKQAPTMTEQARNEKGEALQKKYLEITQNFEKGRSELAQKENEEFQPIVVKLRNVVNGIAQKESFTMVFDAAGIAYAPESLDITAQVIRPTTEEQAEVATPAPRSPRPEK